MQFDGTKKETVETSDDIKLQPSRNAPYKALEPLATPRNAMRIWNIRAQPQD
jgi:hypothetical protein